MTDGSSHRLRYLGHRLVMYGFVGVSLVSSQDIDLNPIPICKHLSDLFSTAEQPMTKPVGQKVEDFEFGGLIATGCDAAVYEAQPVNPPTADPRIQSVVPEAVQEDVVVPEEDVVLQEEEKDYIMIQEESFELVDSDSDVEMQSVSSFAPSDVVGEQPESLSPERVCIKVMFNYGISSNSTAIERAMRRELVPALVTDEECDSYLRGTHVKKKLSRYLPPHPNIIPIYGWFVDSTPLLEDALDMYPIALPYRLCEDGCGRNSTLFIIMKRYESTLAEYLQACGTPDVREGVLLFLQLLHGIQHLQQHDIAHRDLKSDNLLIEWNEGCPELVISDFGHCLTAPLLLSYPNDCMDKGGNGKLMAPEIATADPGPGSYLDFRCSDSWAAGAIGYEIFGGANPFYTTAFDTRSYVEEELPALPPAVPTCVRNVVGGLLNRNPNKRLSSTLASCILSLYLWAPEHWQHETPEPLEVQRWLVHLSAAALLRVPENQQMALFLRNLEWRTLWQAVELMPGAEH